MTSNTCPQNVWNHTSGCACVPASALTSEVTDVDLAAPAVVSVEDFSTRFRTEVKALDKRWRDEEDVNDVFNRLVLNLGTRALDAAEEGRPGRDKLLMAVESFKEDVTDDDMAEEVLFSLDDITNPKHMTVVEDGHGGHTRLFDGRPGVTCENCGNGYATQSVLEAHADNDCTGYDFTRDYSDDRDEDDHDHDALHSAAESFASDINNAGRAEQVKFLRRVGVSDEEILDVVNGDIHLNINDEVLDELVIDACSTRASDAYNYGVREPQRVTDGLEGQRWMLSGDRTLVEKHPTHLVAGECTDVAIATPDGLVTFRVSYNEWVPDGDNGNPANGYLRGEFSAESEWHEYLAPVARESSPFRPAKGERDQMVGYAWDEYLTSLRAAAQQASTKRRNDPLRSYLDGGSA